MYKQLACVGLGGFLGASSRLIVDRSLHHFYIFSFPFSTIIVNILGCFFMGIILGIIEKRQTLSSAWKSFLVTGFCGGLSTFSTFSNDMFTMILNENWLALFGYLAVSIIFGVLFVFLGRYLVHPKELD